MDVYAGFYRDNKEQIFAYLLRLTDNYHLAGDLTQECFIRYLSRYGRNGNNRALLYTLCCNLQLRMVSVAWKWENTISTI